MRNARLDIRPTNGALGAEIHGIDLAKPLDSRTTGELTQALGQHGVIFFRDQKLSPEQHVAFARNFGPVNVNRFFKAVPGHPEVAEVRKEPEQSKNIGGNWHTDHSYDQIPALGSVLLAREVPPRGGDTVFACMSQAYETLSPGLRKTLEGLRGVHSSRHVFGRPQYEREMNGRISNHEAATQDAVHPVVIRHPISGRKVLFVNPGFTTHFEGWTEAESKPLLEAIYAHARRPDYQTRFHWQEGSIAFWDNRATWHYAVNDYAGERRLMHRITVEGVALA